MTIAKTVLGIDVSGAWLDVATGPSGRAGRHANNAKGIDAVVAMARELEAFVVLEATAPWDQALIRALERAEVPFHRANPGRARAFARSAGLLAKTDKVDARMLSSYGGALDLAPSPPMEPQRLKLQALTSRRDQLVAMRKAERIRLKGLPDPEIVESLRDMLAVLDQQIRSLDRRIEAAVADAPALARDAAILRSAPGIGAVASSILLACMPELGQVDRRAAAALAGLAPVARDSGLMRGKRHVQGGRKRIRDALYMAAVTAIRSEQFKPRYDRLRQAGKPSKLAIIAIARQLLVALNAAIRDQKAFSAMTA